MKKTPEHIVLFPDGNRRWAKKRGLATIKGHKKGYDKLINLCKWCKDRGVKVLTAFGFSTENWNRPKEEIEYLMKLLENALAKGLSSKRNVNRLQKEGIRVKVIGQKERLPKSLQETIKRVENLTNNNKRLQLNLAVSYGGRWDITQAFQSIVKSKIPVHKITEDLIGEYLSTKGLPAPDLIIRAGGEKRLSNFLLWQASYAEIWHCPKGGLDFGPEDLKEAVGEYSSRQRRFGKV